MIQTQVQWRYSSPMLSLLCAMFLFQINTLHPQKELMISSTAWGNLAATSLDSPTPSSENRNLLQRRLLASSSMQPLHAKTTDQLTKELWQVLLPKKVNPHQRISRHGICISWVTKISSCPGLWPHSSSRNIKIKCTTVLTQNALAAHRSQDACRNIKQVGPVVSYITHLTSVCIACTIRSHNVSCHVFSPLNQEITFFLHTHVLL